MDKQNSNTADNKALIQTIVSGSISKSEKKVVELLKKIDLLSKNKDFNATIFGQAGSFTFLLKNPSDEQINIERKKQCILNERVIWQSNFLIGDGGDADFR